MSRPLFRALSCAAVLWAALGATPSFAALVLNTGGGTRAGDMLCDTPNTFSYFFVDSTTVTGRATCVNLQGGSGSVRSTTSPGHIGATAISATTGGAAGQSLSAGGDYLDSAFVFHSSVPGVTTALVSLNAVIAGTLGVGGPFGGAGIDFSIAINGQGVGNVRSSLDSSSSSCTSSFAGAVACAGGVFNAAALTGINVLVPLDTPVAVEMRMDVSVSSAATGSSGSAIFGNSLDFPVGVPLFNLPAGVTVNAPDSFVFDNLFSPPTAVPEPPATWLLLAGCAALAWRRAAARALS
jgi:hypothetical protein